MITIDVQGDLTPEFFNREIGPFLEALADLQHNIDEIRGSSRSAVRIVRIIETSGTRIYHGSLTADEKMKLIIDGGAVRPPTSMPSLASRRKKDDDETPPSSETEAA